MERSIQLVVNDEIKAVKKLKTEEATPKDVVLFLASLEATMERLMDIYVSKIMSLGVLDSLKVECSTEALRGISRVVNGIVKGLEVDKKEREALKLLLKVYILRKLINKAGLDVFYTKVAETLRKGLKKR